MFTFYCKVNKPSKNEVRGDVFVLECIALGNLEVIEISLKMYDY